MEQIITGIIIGVIALTLGFIIGFYVKIKVTEKKAEKILREAENEAEVIKKDKILQAKETYLQIKAEFEEQANEKSLRFSKIEAKQNQREIALNARKEEFAKKQKEIDTKIKELEIKFKEVDTKSKEYEVKQKETETKRKEMETVKLTLSQQLETVEQKNKELDNFKREQIEKLEMLSGLTSEEAKAHLIETIVADARRDSQNIVNDIIEEAKINATKEAKKIVINTIQRVGTEAAVENSVTVFHIENDEIKGRIIGREGRNIRALEAATGIEIIVDDTPEAIVLSGFDPVRREIARLALHQLVTDGRIHPARIEEIVTKTRKQIEEEILEVGKRTCIDLGIHGLHPELIRMVGKMKYRSSYGQNLLQHSRETANLCSIMAAELGLNAKLAKRAGLLHDIGKVPDEDTEMPHALYGMKLAEKFKEKPEVCNAIGAHHDEVEMDNLIAPIIQVCDAISGARPGARREVAENYIKRLKDLEALALSYPGVAKSYAIQAGRELRVIVGSDKVSDKEAEILANSIASKIQTEMTYPGQVKITVIREKRAVSYAK